jgi:REP element-mobilizing transposase RayT
MARMAWVVEPGIPHHITQRGNRREATFFNDDDYRMYIQWGIIKHGVPRSPRAAII